MISLRDVVTGFGNRDPLAEVWRRNLRGGGGGSAVITGVPPLRYIGDGRPLTDYMLYGNAIQDSTPSPDAPVDATGCGVRTGNLLDIKDGTETINNVVWTAKHGSITAHGTTTAANRSDSIIVYDGRFTRSGNYINYCKIQASKSIKPPAGTYTFSANANPSDSQRIALIVGDNDAYFANQTARKIAVGETFSVNGNEYVMLVVSSYTTLNQYDFADIMLNLGSTPLPYEPYGYKLPLTVNGTEYPIYLGEVETTRRIKKLVLTGEENIILASQDANRVVGFFTIPGMGMKDSETGYCNILLWKASYSQSEYNRIVANGSTRFYMSLAKSILPEPTIDGFIAYLKQQYQKGSPVTVWYVLAEPETAIVNEPLMKIGDYADTISFAQSQVAIPTVNGENVLDVPTEVPPSQITIKGGIRDV